MLASLRWIAPLVILTLAVLLRVADPQAVQEFRLKVFDNYQRIEPRPYKPAPVVVVDIDNATLSRFGQWPWPRTRLASLTRKLHEAGAATIGYDIVFAEPDRTSPAHVMENWPKTAETARLRKLARQNGLPDHDAIFARRIGQSRAITGFVLSNRAQDATPPRKAGFAHSGPAPSRFLPRFDGAVSNIPVLSGAATGNGSLNVIPESDGVVRRIPLFVAKDETIFPSMAAETLRIAQGASTYLIKSASGDGGFGQESGITKVKIGRIVIPTDAGGQIWLYDSGYQPERSVPAWKIMTGELAPERLQGTLVIIGSSAAGLKDHHPTPLRAATAGVTLHAQILEQALHNTFLFRPDWATGAEVIAVGLCGLLVMILFQFPRLPILVSSALSVLVLGGVVGLGWYGFTEWRWLFDPIYPAATGLAVYMAASLPRYLEVETEKRRVRAAFAHYMSPAMVERLAAHPEELRLGGETRELTVLFCDIRGFTTLAEQMSADGVTRLLNRFLTPMSDAIMETGGTIDKYMGDAIMAFWNAPLDDAGHARNACRAVQRMRRDLATLNAAPDPETGGAPPPIRIGIGLNTGDCSVGNMGSSRRFDYSALGDSVNLAARLEGQCKTYGVDVVLSETTQAAAPDFPVLELDLIRVKGRRDPVRIYTLLDIDTAAGTSAIAELEARHTAMLAAYRAQDWEEAERLIGECREGAAGLNLKELYDVYAARIAALRTNPPPPGWDGVYEALTK